MTAFYNLPQAPPVVLSAAAPASVKQLDRPAWARGLPSHASLVYVRDLAAAALALFLGLHLFLQFLQNPSNVARALREKAGV